MISNLANLEVGLMRTTHFVGRGLEEAFWLVLGKMGIILALSIVAAIEGHFDFN